jgi:hypothetical protein
MTKFYAVVTFGAGNWSAAEEAAKVRGKQRVARGVYANHSQAVSVATHLVGTGSCNAAKVYECDTIEIAQSADISRLRKGERVYAA